jgi:hypothetical protein
MACAIVSCREAKRRRSSRSAARSSNFARIDIDLLSNLRWI